jgi:hypothetical protein
VVCIDSELKNQQQKGAVLQLAALSELLGDEEIETVCRELGHQWRERRLPPGVTVRSMVYRGLHPDHSIKATLADMAAAESGIEEAPSDASWCAARSRLPEELLPQLIQRSAWRLQKSVGNKHLYRGRPVYHFDGSSVSMPDTPELVAAFGYANTKHGPSRFPTARIAFLTLAGVEAVVGYRLDSYRTSEDKQFRSLWNCIPPGALVVFDRFCSSFFNFAKLVGRRVDVITRLHHRRDPAALIAEGRRIGKGQWSVPLTLWPQVRQQYNDSALPAIMHVRLIRVTYRRGKERRTLWLVTTLLNPKKYPRGEIVMLYRRRWEIETRIGSLKTTLKMAVLRSQTTANLRKEIDAIVLAHNLTWTVIHQAAGQEQVASSRISFAGAIKYVLAFSTLLRTVPRSCRAAIYSKMLRAIARQANPYRPGRIEPRLIKRDRRRYGFLKEPRHVAREKCLS